PHRAGLGAGGRKGRQSGRLRHGGDGSRAAGAGARNADCAAGRVYQSEDAMNILVAEDERITRLTLTRQLESLGHKVTGAEDGEQAWERYQGGGFDIVVTDWEMPRLSGVELIQKIRHAAGAAGRIESTA